MPTTLTPILLKTILMQMQRQIHMPMQKMQILTPMQKIQILTPMLQRQIWRKTFRITTRWKDPKEPCRLSPPALEAKSLHLLHRRLTHHHLNLELRREPKGCILDCRYLTRINNLISDNYHWRICCSIVNFVTL